MLGEFRAARRFWAGGAHMSDAHINEFVTFGALLRHLRRRAHLTQHELGAAVGYSAAYITRLEGDTRLPGPDMVRSAFIDALGLTNEPALARRLIALAEEARNRPTPVRNADSGKAGWTALPSHLSSFIGRGQELTQIQQLIVTRRLVTLTGSGGVGKTRLALETATAVAGQFEDGVRLVELAPLSDPALVPQTIARAVGLANAHNAENISALREHLAGRQLLLVLDNCEHVIEACALAADALLRACPQLRILATSREALRIDGEAPWRVPPLTADDAARLFAERAGAARPGFALTDQNHANVALIGARLDGIPLAIELAASRLSGLSVEQLASRLGDRFDLLTDGSRAALPRHRTLRALIDWSYDLLSDQQRVLFRRLSVFVGGFTAEAAERVCAAVDAPTPETRSLYAANVLPLLLDLVSKSLVVADDSQPETRYRLLETIRQYAGEHLAACDEVEYFRQQHARHFQAVVRDTAPRGARPTAAAVHFVLGVDSDPWLKRIALDMDNLRAALTWSLGEARDPDTGASLAHWLYEYWSVRGSPTEAASWIERALELLPQEDNALRRARLLSEIADFSGNIGDLRRAESAGVEALALLRRLPDLFDLMRVLQMRISDLMYRARYVEAAKHAEEWLALARELGDARYEAIALFWLGLQFMNLHDYPKAEALMAESVRTVPPGDEGTLVTARAHQALVWWWGRGEADRARNVMTEVLRYYRETGFEFGIATIQLWLGNINLLCGDLNAARPCYAESVSVLYRLGTYQRIVHPIAGAAALAAADGQGVRAITLWAAADALRAAMGSADLSMAHEGYLARIAAAKSGMTSDAREAAEAAGRVMTVTQAVACVLAD